MPNLSFDAASSAVSFCCSVHVPLSRNTYAEPELLGASFCNAPTTIEVPDIATSKPNLSCAAPSDATSFCVSDHVPSARLNTYTAPALVPPVLLSWGAPTTNVSVSIANALPNVSLPAASDAVSFCCSDHVPLSRNTYAAPELPPASSFPGAPTTTVSPSIATKFPKLSCAAASEAVSFCCSVQLHGAASKHIRSSRVGATGAVMVGTHDDRVAVDRHRAAELTASCYR